MVLAYYVETPKGGYVTLDREKAVTAAAQWRTVVIELVAKDVEYE